jgi:hypothetical protein
MGCSSGAQLTGDSGNLSLQDLSWKLVIQMSLSRPSRSADLASLDLDSRRYTKEAVVFKTRTLTKQSRPNHLDSEFILSAFTSNLNLCPEHTLKVYEERTKSFRIGEEQKQYLFLALIKPHRPVSPSTIARWTVSLLAKAGIDTTIFKAHSTRGAAVTSAANKGVTMADILKAADWTTESVFTKFYYKPTSSSTFGLTVLNNQLQTTHVDMETEPSEI